MRLNPKILAVVSLLAAASANASDQVGVYALVDRVTTEPASGTPTRVRIDGAFAVAEAATYPGYTSPARGYMYFACPAGKEATCEMEWKDIASAAGTGGCAAFGSRRTDNGPLRITNGRVRPTDESPSSPDSYPISFGVSFVPAQHYICSQLVAFPPAVSAGGPYAIGEGSPLTLRGTCSTGGGAWDLDGDGKFGDALGTAPTVDTARVDGPTTWTIAFDCRGTVAQTTVMVANLPPRVESLPPQRAEEGKPWTYALRYSDPAGAADPVAVRLANAPVGMVLGADGVLRWDAPVAGSAYVRLVLSDDDGGSAEHAFTIAVSVPGRPPTPLIVSPLPNAEIEPGKIALVVAHTPDPTGATLTYRFDLESARGEREASEPVASVGDEVRWEPTTVLRPAETYTWSVRATDGVRVSPLAQGVFRVRAPAAAGCGCAHAGGVASLAALAAIAAARARRRSGSRR